MIEFHELAAVESIDAQNWYAERSLSAAQKFRLQLDEAISRIATDPGRFPAIHQKFRYTRIFGFPYIVVFSQDTSEKIFVVAIAHASRRSGYWTNRE